MTPRRPPRSGDRWSAGPTGAKSPDGWTPGPLTAEELAEVRARDAEAEVCARCGEARGGRHDITPEECGQAMGLPVCRDPATHHRFEPAMPDYREAERDRRRLLATLDAQRPTPDELDDLLAGVASTEYASEAAEVVETWTRAKWGVESAMTTQMVEAARRGRR